MVRCLQSMRELRKGMAEYAQNHLVEGFNWEAHIQDSHTYLEEAATEKSEKKELEPNFFEEVRYLAEEERLLAEFKEIKPVCRKLFKYKEQDFKFAMQYPIGNHKQKKKIVEDFYQRIFQIMREDPHCDKYVIVSHSQFINKLMSHFGTKPQGFPNTAYNATTIMRVELGHKVKHSLILDNVRLATRVGKTVDKTAICIAMKKAKKEGVPLDFLKPEVPSKDMSGQIVDKTPVESIQEKAGGEDIERQLKEVASKLDTKDCEATPTAADKELAKEKESTNEQ